MKHGSAELSAFPVRALPSASLPGLGSLPTFVQHNCADRALEHTPMHHGCSADDLLALLLFPRSIPIPCIDIEQSTQEVYFHLIASRQEKEKTTGETVICQDTSVLDPLYGNACCQSSWKSNKHPGSDTPSLSKSILLTSRVCNKN